MAGMPISTALANRPSSLAAPSSMEYSVCTCRCTNESLLTGGALPGFAGCVAQRIRGGPRGRRAELDDQFRTSRRQVQGNTRLDGGVHISAKADYAVRAAIQLASSSEFPVTSES